MSAQQLQRMSLHYGRNGFNDVGDALAVASECARRGDVLGREAWIDSAIDKLNRNKLSVPYALSTAYDAAA